MFNGLWDLQSSAKLTGQTFDAGIIIGEMIILMTPTNGMEN